MMKRWMWLALVAVGLCVGTVAWGHCGKCGVGEAAPAEHKHELCGKCGEEKGGDACCKEGAEKCGTCGLHKGSPGCKEKCKPKEG